MKFVVYRGQQQQNVVGVVKADKAYPVKVAGEVVSDLVPIIADWDRIKNNLELGEPRDISGLQVEAPLPYRDVLCVGKNYSEHAAEFHKSGYDSSDKNEQPSHPVIFTKRYTSIIPHGGVIYPHADLTKTLDYEGELGIILGRPGANISKQDAMTHVWGYVIINDVTARELQRDHKQFYIGKSLDTFCPMGPFVVTADEVDGANLHLETKVNNKLRQQANTSTLIFDIPTLVNTVSGGITIQPGDVIASGTPAGVGFGLSPPTFLQPGDVVSVSISGLGTLTNTIGEKDSHYPVPQSAYAYTSYAAVKSPQMLTRAGDKDLFVEVKGKGSEAIVFVHGLGGSTNFYNAILSPLEEKFKCILFDLEGHGRSPLTGRPDVVSWSRDILALLEGNKIQKARLVGHSLGTLVVNTFAALHPEKVEKIVLIGPVKAIPEAGKAPIFNRAKIVRQNGMIAVADAIVSAATPPNTDATIRAFIRELLLGQDAEGYARAAEALANAVNPDYSKITAPVLVLSGTEDKISSPETCQSFVNLVKAKVETMHGIGHWHAVENAKAVSELVNKFM